MKSLNLCKSGFVFKNQSTSFQPWKGTGGGNSFPELFKQEYFTSSHSSAFSPLFAGLFLMELFLQLPRNKGAGGIFFQKGKFCCTSPVLPPARAPNRTLRSGRAQPDKNQITTTTKMGLFEMKTSELAAS